jgi:hypothetical protein
MVVKTAEVSRPCALKSDFADFYRQAGTYGSAPKGRETSRFAGAAAGQIELVINLETAKAPVATPRR